MTVKMNADVNFVVSFIKEIEQNCTLYNTKDGGASDKVVNVRIWNYLSEMFNEPAIKLKIKWRNIRNCYLRSKRLTLRGTRKMKPYFYSPYLKFLDPYLKNKIQNDTTPVQNAPDQWSDKTMMSGHEQLSDSEDLDSASDTKPSNITMEFHTRKHPDEVVEEKFPNEDFRRFKRLRKDKHLKNDSCELFLRSVAPEMRKMTHKEKLQFRIGVLKLVDRIKFPSISMALMARSPGCNLSNANHTRMQNGNRDKIIKQEY